MGPALVRKGVCSETGANGEVWSLFRQCTVVFKRFSSPISHFVPKTLLKEMGRT